MSGRRWLHDWTTSNIFSSPFPDIRLTIDMNVGGISGNLGMISVGHAAAANVGNAGTSGTQASGMPGPHQPAVGKRRENIDLISGDVGYTRMYVGRTLDRCAVGTHGKNIK